MTRRLYACRTGLKIVGLLLLAPLGACDQPDPSEPLVGRPQRLLVADPGFVDVAAGGVHNCALKADGTVACWGRNDSGRAPALRAAPAGLAYTQVSLGFWHSCALRTDGVVECWGSNYLGEAPPTRNAPSGLRYAHLSGGASYTCAVRSDGVVECWGYNNYGQAPETLTAEGSDFIEVGASVSHTCGLRSDGVVECRGENQFGQAPATRSAGTGFAYTQLGIGKWHSCALRNDGKVDCWGRNTYGAAPGLRSAPSGLTYTQVGSAEVSSCAVRSDGVVECWGENWYGQAPGTRVPPSGLRYTALAAGGYHTCAVRSDGFLECWGDSRDGLTNPPPPPTTHVPPAATFVAPETVPEGSAIELLLTAAQVPGHPEATGFTYAFDCGGGYAAFSASATASCTTVDGPGTREVKGSVKDAAADAAEYTATVGITNVAPTITSFEAPASLALEGGTAQASVSLTFSDPAGGADAPYTTTIDCGNGSTITGDNGSCTYTASGSYTVTGLVRDKDDGEDVDTREIIVEGLLIPTFAFDLSALTTRTYGDANFSVADYATTNSTGAITFATGAGSVGCSVSAGVVSIIGAAVGTDQCIIEASLAESGNYAAAGPIAQGFNIARAPGSVSITNIPSSASYGGSFTPTFNRAGDGSARVSEASGSCSAAGGVVQFTGVGTCTLTAWVAEGSNHLAANGPEQSFTIESATTTLVIRMRPKQYSDPAWASAAIAWQNGTSLAEEATGTVQFRIDGAAVGAPQPVVGGMAQLTEYVLTQAPGQYPLTAEFTSTNPNYASSISSPGWMLVQQEDARVVYTGPEFVSTSSAGATTANVLLSATIQDITAVDPADAHAGDIRHARVSFVNGENGQELCVDLTPILLNSGDLKTGTVGCTVSLGTGSTSGTPYTIGIRVSDYYIRNSWDDVATVTVAQPINGMITGGGRLLNATSAGQYAGGAGLNTNFGFNVKYNKNMTNLQGSVNIIVRGSDGKVYQIKSNAMSSLALNVPAKGSATFMSKASLRDITDPGAPVSLGGNLDLQMTMTDNGTPGAIDALGITLRNNSGALLFSSSWNGQATSPQNLRSGAVVVR